MSCWVIYYLSLDGASTVIFLKAGDWTIGSVSESSITKAVNSIQVIAGKNVVVLTSSLNWLNWLNRFDRCCSRRRCIFDRNISRGRRRFRTTRLRRTLSKRCGCGLSGWSIRRLGRRFTIYKEDGNRYKTADNF